MKTKTRIVFVDDHVLFREGFRDLLTDQADFDIVGEGGDGRDAVTMVSQLNPDVLLIDLRLPKLGGVSAIQQIKQTHDDLKVVVISMYEDDDHKREAILAGADAYHSKMDRAGDIIKTIRRLVSGKPCIDPVYLKKIREEQEAQPDVERRTLTPTETRVLEELSKGLANKELADTLSMSERTVKNHLNAIFKKMGVKSRLEAIKVAIDKKWISMSL